MLAEAVSSVLNQSQKDIEIIIIDDCSTDGTEEFVKTITDSRVHYLKNEKNSGQEFSRSYGFRQSKGKYITFLDDDDYYTDYDFFSKAIKIFEDNDSEDAPIAFVCANAEQFMMYTGEIRKGNIGTPGRISGVDYIFNRNKPHSTFPTLFKAEILRKAGLDNLIIFDTMTYREAALLGDVYFMSDYVGVYRVHKESWTLGYTNHTRDEARRLDVVCELIRREKIWADKLSKIVDRKKVQKFYINDTWIILHWLNWPSIKTIPSTQKKVALHILKVSGFMPSLWFEFIYRFVRSSLRKITPLRKVYRFIKYRGKVPEDDIIF